jgi:hypothetical protein
MKSFLCDGKGSYCTWFHIAVTVAKHLVPVAKDRQGRFYGGPESRLISNSHLSLSLLPYELGMYVSRLFEDCEC